MFEFTPKLLIWLWLICTFVGILGCLYALIAAGLLAKFAQKRVTRNSCNRPVSVLKPLYDTEPELEANLTSFCGQNYGGEVELIFGLQTGDDPASLVVASKKSSMAVLNRFPYASGHLMVIPKKHIGNIEELTAEEVAELWELFVLEALRRNDWNVRRAAIEVGMQRPNFQALMRKYQLAPHGLLGRVWFERRRAAR